jgi:hypothetical protein
VVARNGSGGRGHGYVVVDAVHVLVADLRTGCRHAVGRKLRDATIDLPAAVGRADARVELWRRLAAGLLRPPQGSGYADGSAGLVDALVSLQRQVCGARRGGRDVHWGVGSGAVGRVLHRLAVGVLLVGCVLRNGSRGRELGGHVGSSDDARRQQQKGTAESAVGRPVIIRCGGASALIRQTGTAVRVDMFGLVSGLL